MSNFNDDRLFQQMKRIADALERQWPPLPNSADLVPAEAYVWHSDIRQLLPVHKVNRLALELLRGCLLYTSPSPRDLSTSRMPSSA